MTVYKLTEQRYIVKDGENSIDCHSLKTTIKTLLSLRVRLEEIEAGFEDMIANDHNCAEYGDINRTYMFTKKVA